MFRGIGTEKKEAEMNDLKKAITPTPTLRYYDVSKYVLIQCDASKCGLGSVTTMKTNSVYIESVNGNGDSLCTNRKGNASNSICVQQIQTIYIWQT